MTRCICILLSITNIEEKSYCKGTGRGGHVVACVQCVFLPISTHLEQRFGGDRINHSTTPVTMPEKSRNSGLFKALNA